MTNFINQDGEIYSLSFSPDGSKIASGGNDKKVLVWDPYTGKMLTSFSRHKKSVNMLFYYKNNIIFSSDDNKTLGWNVQTQKIIFDSKNYSLEDYKRTIISDNGNSIALVFDTEDIYNSDSIIKNVINDTAKMLNHQNKSQTVLIGDPISGDILTEFTDHTNIINVLKFSPEGNIIASADRDNIVKVWASENGSILTDFNRHKDLINTLAFSPDGKRIASGSNDHTVKIWDIKSGRILVNFTEHDTGVNAVTFSPDGNKIVSGGNDNKVKVWSSKTGNLHTEFNQHKDNVNAVSFSPCGHKIASGSSDNTVKIWTDKVEVSLEI